MENKNNKNIYNDIMTIIDKYTPFKKKYDKYIKRLKFIKKYPKIILNIDLINIILSYDSSIILKYRKVISKYDDRPRISKIILSCSFHHCNYWNENFNILNGNEKTIKDYNKKIGIYSNVYYKNYCSYIEPSKVLISNSSINYINNRIKILNYDSNNEDYKSLNKDTIKFFNLFQLSLNNDVKIKNSCLNRKCNIIYRYYTCNRCEWKKLNLFGESTIKPPFVFNSNYHNFKNGDRIPNYL